MMFITGKELDKIVISKSQGLKRHDLYSAWRRIYPFVIILSAIMASIWGKSFFNFYYEDIMDFFNTSSPGLKEKILSGIFMFFVILILDVPILILHELIHYIALPNHNKKYIVFSLPVAISVFYDGWVGRRLIII